MRRVDAADECVQQEVGKPVGGATAGTSQWYNFVRIHQTLRVTPAMAAGVTILLRDLEDLITA